ncbi:hypothetical protein Pse7367_3408 [Thalassoporum mexicanum PCC 7367]|uniref:hypothetical protein n=1 Tax=Thalassoporum mexicanum TaxID=3457544 RepID=UPI00029FA47E|nr:hypothetical protein [Pseudanabaena sp. PCC 7367]AFY71645.1 hypothetical protein Pse7367_3408 [Pseudanabaena sp. PCC 7367]
MASSIWIQGHSRSGKTNRACQEFARWIRAGNFGLPEANDLPVGINNPDQPDDFERSIDPAIDPAPYEQGNRSSRSRLNNRINDRQLASQSVLTLSVNAKQRQKLNDRLTQIGNGQYPVTAETPLSFFRREVELYWPLLINLLGKVKNVGKIKAQFPIVLRVENEQELASEFWEEVLDQGTIAMPGVGRERLVRRMLDLFLLAANSGKSLDSFAGLGDRGIESLEGDQPPAMVWQEISKALTAWRHHCWQNGLLTYGIITDLYRYHLLPHAEYRARLAQRFRYVIADDVDEFPAIACDLCKFLLDHGAKGVFTFNPNGSARLGLGADPAYWLELEQEAETIETLEHSQSSSIAEVALAPILDLVIDPNVYPDMGGDFSNYSNLGTDFRDFRNLNDCTIAIETTSRAALLRQCADIVAEAINTAIETERVKPNEIAIIAPGLDNIAEYALREILSKKNIPFMPLNPQKPIVNNPQVRSLLTLLTLVYPNLGRLVNRDQVAEMLVVLSQVFNRSFGGGVNNNTELDNFGQENLAQDQFSQNSPAVALAAIGSTGQADRQTQPESAPTARSPITRLQSTQTTIDPVRAGILADHCFVPHPDQPRLLESKNYSQWNRLGNQVSYAYEQIRAWIEAQSSQLTPLLLLDRAIQKFFIPTNPSYDQLSTLQELIETAQYYWQIGYRLNWPEAEIITRFINLIRQGTITSNPYTPNMPDDSVIFASIYQYRMARGSHKIQFWLDLGSSLWQTSRAAFMYGAPLFRHDWDGQPWTIQREQEIDQRRLHDALQDLLHRTTDRLVFCYSELGTNGQLQVGSLSGLIDLATPIDQSVYAPPELETNAQNDQ